MYKNCNIIVHVLKVYEIYEFGIFFFFFDVKFKLGLLEKYKIKELLHNPRIP